MDYILEDAELFLCWDGKKNKIYKDNDDDIIFVNVTFTLNEVINMDRIDVLNKIRDTKTTGTATNLRTEIGYITTVCNQYDMKKFGVKMILSGYPGYDLAKFVNKMSILELDNYE